MRELAAKFGEFDLGAQRYFLINRREFFVRIVQFRICSIGKRGKIALGDSPGNQPVPDPVEQHQRALSHGAVFSAIPSLALEGDKRTEC